MSTTTPDINAAVKAEAKEIVTSGTNIRPRLAEVVAQAAPQSQESGESFVSLMRAVMDGAREGFDKSVPSNRDEALRQVVDALGDGLSRTALAGKLAVEEAVSSSRQYTREDLARFRDDLTAVRELFGETIERGLKTYGTLTKSQVSSAVTHASRVAERIGPVLTQVHDALREHPVDFARHGLKAGAGMGEGAAGALFQALGRMLQRAGDELRREIKPDR